MSKKDTTKSTIKMKKSGEAHVLEIELPAIVFPDGDYFIAYAPTVKVCIHALTAKEAKKELDDALYLFFQYHLERGTLDKTLSQLGYKKEGPQMKMAATGMVNIPFELLQNINSLMNVSAHVKMAMA